MPGMDHKIFGQGSAFGPFPECLHHGPEIYKGTTLVNIMHAKPLNKAAPRLSLPFGIMTKPNQMPQFAKAKAR